MPPVQHLSVILALLEDERNHNTHEDRANCMLQPTHVRTFLYCEIGGQFSLLDSDMANPNEHLQACWQHCPTYTRRSSVHFHFRMRMIGQPSWTKLQYCVNRSRLHEAMAIRLSPVTPDDRAGDLWVVTILATVYTLLCGLLRIHIKRRQAGFDDTFFGLATVRALSATTADVPPPTARYLWLTLFSSSKSPSPA